jgi:hypothetical protein
VVAVIVAVVVVAIVVAVAVVVAVVVLGVCQCVLPPRFETVTSVVRDVWCYEARCCESCVVRRMARLCSLLYSVMSVVS